MIARALAFAAALGLLGCGGSQSCRRNLPDGGCDIYITTDHCSSCPTGFEPADSAATVGCVPSNIGCQ